MVKRSFSILMAALALRISPDYAPRGEGGVRKAADRMADAKFWMAEAVFALLGFWIATR